LMLRPGSSCSSLHRPCSSSWTCWLMLWLSSDRCACLGQGTVLTILCLRTVTKC
jgi:hypothetical protein